MIEFLSIVKPFNFCNIAKLTIYTNVFECGLKLCSQVKYVTFSLDLTIVKLYLNKLEEGYIKIK